MATTLKESKATDAIFLIHRLVVTSVNSYRATNETVRFKPQKAYADQDHAAKALFVQLTGEHPTAEQLQSMLDL